MKLEVLVAAMNQQDFSLCEQMNLKTDALIINQCVSDLPVIQTIQNGGKQIRMYTLPAQGVGRSRNQAILHAEGDILLFADEDVIYLDKYEEIILNAFQRFSDADVILFEVESLNPNRPLGTIKKEKKIHSWEATSYGACRIAVRRRQLLKANVWFSLLFGGGAQYLSGEDSLFLQDVFRSGLRVYTCTEKIADIRQETSTWFDGYSKRYFEDKGALYAAMYGKKAFIPLFYFSSRQAGNAGQYSRKQVLKWMRQGFCEFLEREKNI